ncbi:MAG: hypothetical protein BWY71_02052 [Planctomycetes bacterium ADurb.Bin412]|nr:MAG: hypothetical protein BWY71_02052 [Planctomycetes bacterium ADurb.Bin412]
MAIGIFGQQRGHIGFDVVYDFRRAAAAVIATDGNLVQAVLAEKLGRAGGVFNRGNLGQGQAFAQGIHNRQFGYIRQLSSGVFIRLDPNIVIVSTFAVFANQKSFKGGGHHLGKEAGIHLGIAALFAVGDNADFRLALAEIGVDIHRPGD